MAGEVVVCPHCRTPAEVPSRLRGALINCRKCGRVVDVPGMRDPLWVLVRIGLVALVIASVWLGTELGSLWLGLAAGAVVAFFAWLACHQL
jgi:hypothetical protein